MRNKCENKATQQKSFPALLCLVHQSILLFKNKGLILLPQGELRNCLEGSFFIFKLKNRGIKWKVR